MDGWTRVLLLSLGGALGVNARYFTGMWVTRLAGQQYPWATFVINVTGSFAIGFVMMVLGRWLPHQNYRLFFVTGFLGGYTTYSSFAFESLTLWERGERGLGFTYATSTFVGGFLAVALGAALARSIHAPSRPDERPNASRTAEALGTTTKNGVSHESGRGGSSPTVH